MKKSSKKIPKTHLPKYTFGDEVPMNQQSSYNPNVNPMYRTNDSGMGPNGQADAYQAPSATDQGGNSTSNMYNDKRAEGLNNKGAQQAGMYAAAGTAAINGGVNMMNTYKNPDATVAQGWDAGANTGADIVGAFGPWGQVLSMGIKGTNMGGKVLREKVFERQNADGSLKNPRLAEAAAFTNTVANPLTWGSMINKGIYTPRKYRDTVEQENKDRIAQENTIYAKYGGQMKYAMGGMNMQPNAEVEGGGYGKDGENTLNPDGTATQFNGPTHEQGGIKTNLDPGTLIFSDKVKWNGKTAADHNKPYTKIIQKATKDLENSSLTKESKLSAHLNLMSATKASQAIFAKQEETKQSRIDSYTKRLGGIMKYPDGGKIPSYLQDKINFNKKLVEDYGSAILGSGMQSDMLNNSKIGLNKFDILLGYKSKDVPDHIKYSGDNVSKLMNALKFYEDKYQKHSNGGVQKYEYGGIQQFKKGGVKGNTYTPRVQDTNDSEDIVVPGNYPKTYQDFSGILAPSAYDKQMDITDANTLDKSAWEVDYRNNPNAPKPSSNTSEQSNKFDWKGLGTQAAYFAANNAGNIYDLARADKTETRKYDRATENLITPNFRDADQKYLYMKNALKGASLGASGYLANLQQSHVNNVLNKAQIQQAADNTNAGIKNQVSQYNTGIANEEILANAKIRANARNIKQSAIASMGSNTANQMNDVRNTNMDKKKMEGLIKMYPALSKDPKMLEYFMSFNA